MSDVRKWYIGVYGGEAQARTCSPHPNEVIRDREGDTFVLSRDHMAREAELKQGITKHWQIVCDQRAKIDALQALLTAADERADVLEGLLRDVKGVLAEFAGSSSIARKAYRDIDAALKQAEGGGDDTKPSNPRRILSDPHCPECGHPDCNGQCFGDDMMGD